MSLPQRWPTPALVMANPTPPARVMAKEKGCRPTQVRALGKPLVRRLGRRLVRQLGRRWLLALTWGMVRAILPEGLLGCQPWRSCFAAAVQVK